MALPQRTEGYRYEAEPADLDEFLAASPPQIRTRTRRRVRILMVATACNMSYRVLRCARASGAEIWVLGNAGAGGLRFSRCCRRFLLSDCLIHGGRDEGLALEINCLSQEHAIDMVIPGDAPSTRALIASADLLRVPSFPLPSLEVFDCLNDKWAFAQLCDELSIPTPETRLLPNLAALKDALAAGSLQYPFVAKPLSRSGAGGVLVLEGPQHRDRLTKINYSPVLVQAFIAGKDIGASVFARAGEIQGFVAHSYFDQYYAVLEHESIWAELSKIVEHFKLDGVYNFDMRLAPDGAVSYLECNPRFFWKIYLSMLAGINFVELGLPGRHRSSDRPQLCSGGVRMPKALVRGLLRTLTCTGRDWAAVRYLFSDPVPLVLEKLSLTV